MGRCLFMQDVDKLIQQSYKETERIIAGINRRLESHGKIVYTPEYYASDSTAKIHLSQYTDILNQLSSTFKENWLTQGNAPVLMRRKGTYLQISRSRESIEALQPITQELKQIYDQIPSMQETQERIQSQSKTKLSRKQVQQSIIRESDIQRLSDIRIFLAESELVDDMDDTLQTLLAPFRGRDKGGTREEGAKVSESDYNALVSYLRSTEMFSNTFTSGANTAKGQTITFRKNQRK